jgi:predicted DNA-binding WGR domain protein
MAVIDSIYLELINPAKNEDKFYQIELTESGGIYDVFATYGRRGTGGQATSKYHGEDLDAAQTAYNRALADKTKGGYKQP